MANTPQLLGSQVNFQTSWNSGAGELTIFNHEILNYRKIPFPPSTPTYEIGPLGQLSQRQLNLGTIPYRFEFQFLLSDDKKNDLEGMISGQQKRYFENNNRSDVDIILNDERIATLELLTRARGPSRNDLSNRFDTNPTAFSAWQYSQFIVKCEEFLQNRFNADLWLVSVNFNESRLNLEDLTT